MTEETLDCVRTTFGADDGTAVAAVAQDALEASRARLGAWGDGALWSGLEFDVHGLTSVIMYEVGKSPLAPDGLHFAHLQSLLAMAVGKVNFP